MGTAISKAAILGLATSRWRHPDAPSRPQPGPRAHLPRGSALKPGRWQPRPAGALGCLVACSAAPPGWRVAQLASGAVLRYPPGWRRIAGDSGTATAVLQDTQHPFLDYLNLTPRQGNENLSTWAAFRTRHDTLEGDRRVTRLAAVTAVPFRTGTEAAYAMPTPRARATTSSNWLA
jgi:hypothetical protein